MKKYQEFVSLFHKNQITMKSGIQISPYTQSQGLHPRVIVSPIGVINNAAERNRAAVCQTTAVAMWDTGADYCCISSRLINLLGLKSFGTSSVNGVDGLLKRQTYAIGLVLPNNIYFEDVIVLEDHGLDDMNIDMIVGMAVINELDFAITHNDKGESVLSISHPGCRLVDFTLFSEN